ncbi:tetratricopeptide repeat protein [Undibacterium sp. Di27W]|uniref:tetratricopeptide repeat protein n=1 Tax=Undibacterium sp. Di27W TaxID=3413036 RepID=UPI003BF439F5
MFKKILSLFDNKKTPNPPAEIENKSAADQLPEETAELLKDKGDKLLTSGQSSEAILCYEAAISKKPEYADAYINLSIALRTQKQFAAALARLEQARKISPDDAYIFFNMGMLANENGDRQAAIKHFEKTLELAPDLSDAYLDLAVTHLGNADLEAARKVLIKAAMRFPQYVDFHLMLGNIYKQQHQWDLAIASYKRTTLLKPDCAEAHGNLAWILQEQDQSVAAEISYRELLKLEPGRHEAHYNLGNVLSRLGKFEDALASYQKTLAIDAEYMPAHHNMGNVLRDVGRQQEAELSFRKVIASNSPHVTGAYIGLGDVLRNTGKMSEALGAYRSAIQSDPAYFDAHDCVLFNLSFGNHCSADEYKSELMQFHEKLRASASPYSSWNTRNKADAKRKLRVGLVSGDLGIHPVGYFLENVIRHINPDLVDFVAYSNKTHNDALAAHLKQHCSAWHNIEAVGNEAAAKMIYEDEIDILIDLAGHTALNRLPVFAWKPAPVQVSWLGYFGSTGVPGMDYLLTDRISVPEQHEEYFSEKIWYLPETRLCFSPPTSNTADVDLASLMPVQKNGHITFGCFQSVYKINDYTLQLWGRIFQQIPGAKLRFQCKQFASADACTQMLERIAQHGITAERVSLSGPSSRLAYLAAHAEVDIILDTYPYAGGTTTCEALWMGVPTVTLAGHTMSSRQGASLLSYAGLDDWIASDEDGYVALAVKHAEDVQYLQQLRSELREKLLRSSLFDGKRFARNLEIELQKMWTVFIANHMQQ